MKRRALLTTAASLLAAPTPAWGAKALSSSELELFELALPGDSAFGRLLLAVPRALPSAPELVVLLHGLGETYDQTVGARAFAERYGLLSAVARLTHPPLARTNTEHDYFGDGRLLEINARLEQRPYRCPVLVCPFTPNPYKPGGDEALARFTSFVVGPMKSAIEQRVGVEFPAPRMLVAGVSLGGYLAIEIFLKKPELFCGFVSAQGAFGPQQAARYAAGVQAAVSRVGARRVEILTTTFDPYRHPNELLQRHLQERKQASRLRVSPGPHDQRWLNESGVIEMLLCADDVLAEPRAEAT